MRRVAVGRIALEVEDIGSGPAVVLLHGFPESAYSWRHQMTALAEAGYRVIVPNQRGYAGSDKPAHARDYRIERLVEDVVGLLDALSVDRATIVGHDWGAMVAWAAMAQRPERFERLVVMNGPHPDQLRRYILGHPLQLPQFLYMFLFQLPILPERRLKRPGLLARVVYKGAGDRSAIDPELLAELERNIHRPGAAKGMVDWYRAAMRYRTPELSRVRAPVLCIWGDRDPVLVPAFAEGLERFADDVRVRHIPDAGHWVQQERPAEVSALLLEALS